MKVMCEKIISEILKISEKFLETFLEKMQWKTFFENKISFFTNNVNNDFVNGQLKNLFSPSSIKKLTNIMNNKNGFTFKKEIESKLWEILEVFDATDDEKNIFISRFVTCLLEYLKENKPDLYNEYITDEIFKIVSYEYKLIEQNNDICQDIKKYITSPKNILSIYELNNILINSSSLKIDLSFFESDDKSFIENFKENLINNQNINIVSTSRYEALMTVLYELKKNQKNAVVVFDYDDWMKIYNKNTNNTNNNLIFIPFFYNETILAIPNSKNIFIYDDSSPCNLLHKIVINRRSMNFVNAKLIEFHMNYSDAYKLLDVTHGFFVPMSKRLFDNSQFLSSYEISESDIKVVLCAILFGQWTNCKGDQTIINKISGMEYRDFISVINKYCIGNNPLIFKYNIYGEEKYIITSLEDALFQFNYLIDNYIWKDYLDILDVLLLGVEEKYKDLSAKNNINIFSKSNYSNTIKEGVYKTLLYFACCLDDTKKQNDIKRFFEKNLSRITSVNEWASISKYIKYISEIAPEEFLKRIEIEFENNENDGFIELFEMRNDSLFGENYYINYIWALEQLLSQKKYVYRSLDILFLIDEIERDYKMSNSPKNTLMEVFCAWTNLSCIENCEKVGVLDKYIEKNPKNIIYALDNLPKKNLSIIGGLAKPKYRLCEVNVNVTLKDTIDIYNGYLDLCIKSMEYNHDIIPTLIDDIDSYPKAIISNFFEKLGAITTLLNDEEKYQVKYKLRCVIYKHRFHKDAEWSMPEEKIDLFARALNEITFSNRVYDYKYLFEKTYEFPLLNPIPYESNEYSNIRDENKKLVKNELCDKINDFNNKGFKLSELIKIIDSDESNLGQYIYLFDHKYYSKETLHTIVDLQKNTRIIEQYSWNIIRYDKSNFYSLFNELISISFDHETLIEILRQYPIDDSFVTFLNKLSFDDLKIGVWSKPLHFSSNLKSYEIIFKNIKQYGNEDTYLNTLFYMNDLMQIEKVYDYLIDILSFNGVISRNHEYELYTLLKEIKLKLSISDEKLEKLASVELKHWYMLEWHQMHFLQEYVVKYSNIYSEILKYIYKNDDDEFILNHKDYVSMMYKIYYKMEFCPGNINGNVNEDIFKKWIDDFYSELVLQKQTSLFSSCMGKLCAYSPFDDDGMPLAKCVRIFIEENSNKEFISSFVTSELNKRGVYTNTGGVEEHEISLRYRNYADYLRKDYPKCAYLFDLISDDYELQSEQEKTRARYEQ